MDDDTRTALRSIGQEIANARFAVAFTGAGISTESGLPDYRGTHGLWRNGRFEELANIETFEREPAEFWQFYSQRLGALRGAEPNAAHTALETLCSHELINFVITQNVDGLHRREALGSRLVELHGTLRLGTCLRCRRDWRIEEVEQRLAAADDEVPRCDCGYPIKPGVTLFGERLDEETLDVAMRAANASDYLLCLGSSLQVMPAAAIPAFVLEHGGKVAIINQGATDYDEEEGVIRIEASLAEAMPIVVDGAARNLGYPETSRSGSSSDLK
jgi:NAD-dependent protein deacetylase/lipoamidase